KQIMKIKANQPQRRSGITEKATSIARRMCDQKSLPRGRRRRKLSSGVRWPRDFSSIEVFDFKEKWQLVLPFLHQPEIEAVLERGVREYLLLFAKECGRWSTTLQTGHGVIAQATGGTCGPTRWWKRQSPAESLIGSGPRAASHQRQTGSGAKSSLNNFTPNQT